MGDVIFKLIVICLTGGVLLLLFFCVIWRLAKGRAHRVQARVESKTGNQGEYALEFRLPGGRVTFPCTQGEFDAVTVGEQGILEYKGLSIIRFEGGQKQP